MSEHSSVPGEAAAVLERLRRLVELESPSGDAARLTALADEIARALTSAGAAVTAIDVPSQGRHLRATLDGDAALPPLLVLGHMDTVFAAGTLAERPFAVAGGRATGPGVYDMKAGIAVLLQALADMHARGAQPRRPLRILLTCDEEVGSHSSRPLIQELATGAAATLVLEPALPGGAAKTARKGVAVYTLRTYGRATHAGLEPQTGINAITELAHQVLAAQALARPELGTTVTAGLIAGGTASNVVPAEAWAELDVRFSTAVEAARVDAGLHALTPVVADARLALEGGVNRPPLERTAASAALYARARDLAAALGFDLEEGTAGGASDGNLTGALGVPTLDGLGPDGGGAHGPDEHVLVADLPRRISLIVALLQQF